MVVGLVAGEVERLMLLKLKRVILESRKIGVVKNRISRLLID